MYLFCLIIAIFTINHFLIDQSAKRGRVRRDLVGAASRGQGQKLGQLLESWGSFGKVGAALGHLGQHLVVPGQNAG